MRSYDEGSLSATTQVKVLSPEIIHFALGQGFHFPEANTAVRATGKYTSGVPGSESVAGKRIDYIGTWENRAVPFRSSQGAEEVTREYVSPVVGPFHSREVVRVMPGEPTRALEGNGSLTQGKGFCHARH